MKCNLNSPAPIQKHIYCLLYSICSFSFLSETLKIYFPLHCEQQTLKKISMFKLFDLIKRH